MEQHLNCNVQECNSQLMNQAVVTVCSHVICSRCANNHGLAGSAPFTCPVCRQSLGVSEVCEQVLQPSEEWKSVALSGLSPTIVMECAGRALGFWSYQMTNQISYQVRKNSKLKDYCAELQGEIENIWGQANQRIGTLTVKIRDMEREEHDLRRQCEELRLTLENRTRELTQSQELYSKLKQRVLIGQSQQTPPGAPRSQTPMRPHDTIASTHVQVPQLPISAQHANHGLGRPNYFPASPGQPRAQTRSNLIADWNRPTSYPRVPATPLNKPQFTTPKSLAFQSTPKTGGSAMLSRPGPGQLYQAAAGPQSVGRSGLRGLSTANLGVAGIKRSASGGNIDVPGPSFGQLGGVSRTPPVPKTRQEELHHFEPPGQIFQRP
ncbi:hypothetical protein B0J18DRAFT_41408 [Chaetomium sp. MPI-SDFR-AT-0129]|nr:hypothetical protein B0J18DRAFT_41408 [Chaetomium sp. MPI-SDFR-AT-0129]